MRQTLAVVVFLILWKFNKDICDYYYPDYKDDFNSWYYFRCKIYEVMFFIALLFPFTKTTRISKSVTAGGLFYVGCSVVDKVLQGIHLELLRDWFVVLPASIFIGYLTYKKGNVFKN